MDKAHSLVPGDKENTLWEDVYLDKGTDDEYEDASESHPDAPNSSRLSHHKSQKQYIPIQGIRRYNSALKNLILIRSTKRSGKSLGLDEAGLWSFLTFSWLSKFIYKAYKEGIDVKDIPDIPPLDSSEYNVQRLEMIWHDELAKKGPGSASLGKAAWRFMRTRFIVSSILFTIYIIIGFISTAFLMRYLLEYAESEDESWVVGLKWALLLAFSEIVRLTVYSQIWALNMRTALRLRSACLTMLYRKILRLNGLGRNSAGELINLFANDGQRIYDLVLFGPMVIGGPVTVILGSVYIYWLLGPWALLGFSSMFLFYPLQYGLTKLGGYFRAKALTVTDRRISYIFEILYSIKLIKMCAWNKVFTKGINEIRKEEVSSVRKTAYCTSLASSLSSTAPIISSILTLAAHILAEHTITASQAFTIISLIPNHLRLSFTYFSYGWANYINLKITFERMKPVLILNETKTLLSRSLDKSQAVCIANGTFVRESAQRVNQKVIMKKNIKAKTDEETMRLNCLPPSPYTIILRDVNFYAPKGKLIGVCGPVGCGKTSLLLSIMGLLRMTEGKLCRDGSCAYVSQQSWLLNATVKENILFGEKFNAKRYFTVLHFCCLNEDIDALPGGDGTEVGDRGITLSGGQKQRVALARALYSDRDIYLLDDPLSSVDTHVGSQIFEKCILLGLKSRTVVLVTNQSQYLSHCHEVVVMKEGTIIERGTHEELTAKNGEYALMMQTIRQTPKDDPESTSRSRKPSVNDCSAPNRQPVHSSDKIIFPGKQLVLEEKVAKGSIKLHTFLSYINASGGSIVFLSAVLLMLINVGSAAFSSWWLAMWIKDGDGNSTAPFNKTVELHLTDNPNYNTYLLVYFLSIAAIVFTNFLRTIVFAQVTLRASSQLFNRLFQKLLSSPLVFFERTPVGRIQNLFSKDIDEVETRLPLALESLIQGIWQVAAAILFICIVFRWFIVPLLFLVGIYYIVNKVYRVGIRDLMRLDNLTRSPIFGNVSATVQGLDTIHAFNKEKDFINKFTQSFDLNAVCLFMNALTQRWLALRIDFLAVIVMLITSLFIILFHGDVSPSLAGLAIAYAATLSGTFQYAVRMLTENESKFLSVERINMYLEGMEQEGGHGPKGIPPEKWPDLGSLKFKNVKLQYRLGLPFALDNVSFKIDPAQKIGIVGRTGAGKSSLITALFRLVELQSGKISIDSLDVSTINIETLRSRLSIIPQDPVLFSGTLRYNLDPLNSFQDTDIWSVLEKTKLKDKVSSDPDKLNFKVKQNGENLSVGERQLICMARALLRDSKIMVLDEATSGLDPDTEKFVHDIIFSEFQHCTILLIAHRLESVKSCDKVLVIDNGKVAEFDTPEKLLNNPDSFFTKLIRASIRRESHVESH